MRDERLPRYSHLPFPEALGNLLRALQTDPVRPVTMRQLFGRVEGYGYDALRKMTRGELRLQPGAMEAIARAAGIIAPDYFLEYRRHIVQERLIGDAPARVIDFLYERMASEEYKLMLDAVLGDNDQVDNESWVVRLMTRRWNEAPYARTPHPSDEQVSEDSESDVGPWSELLEPSEQDKKVWRLGRQLRNEGLSAREVAVRLGVDLEAVARQLGYWGDDKANGP